MKDRFRSSKKYLVIPVALGLVAIVALANAHSVSAAPRFRHTENFSSVMAPGFGLEHEEVQVAVAEYHEGHFKEHHDQMQDRLYDRLLMAVDDERITPAQMNAMLAKHDEMYEELQWLQEQDYSVEDMREFRADLHEELELWAEANGIDMYPVMYAGKYVMGAGAHMGQGFHGDF